MKERREQMRRCVELRAQGRSGVRIAARVGIGLRTLRRWTDQDETFGSVYNSAYRLWQQGEDEALRLLLAGFHPERQLREKVPAET